MCFTDTANLYRCDIFTSLIHKKGQTPVAQGSLLFQSLVYRWQLRVPTSTTSSLLPPWWMAPQTMTEVPRLSSVGRMHASIRLFPHTSTTITVIQHEAGLITEDTMPSVSEVPPSLRSLPHMATSPVIALRPRQNGRHFADDTFKPIFLNENIRLLIKISLKFVPKLPINNIPTLVQVMAWRRSGDKPLSESMMVCLLTHICVTRPQWVIQSQSGSPGGTPRPIASNQKPSAILRTNNILGGPSPYKDEEPRWYYCLWPFLLMQTSGTPNILTANSSQLTILQYTPVFFSCKLRSMMPSKSYRECKLI